MLLLLTLLETVFFCDIVTFVHSA